MWTNYCPVMVTDPGFSEGDVSALHGVQTHLFFSYFHRDWEEIVPQASPASASGGNLVRSILCQYGWKRGGHAI